MARPLIPRAAQALVEQALRRSPVVAVVGPRQCGKTTLARQLVPPDSPNYFDLEDPVSLARLDQRVTALRDLAGLVVIDEVQHRPDLFPVLRVLADRDDNPARFLVLGSAGPGLLRQSAESLAGRIEYVELTGLQVAEVGAERMPRRGLLLGDPQRGRARPAAAARRPARGRRDQARRRAAPHPIDGPSPWTTCSWMRCTWSTRGRPVTPSARGSPPCPPPHRSRWTTPAARRSDSARAAGHGEPTGRNAARGEAKPPSTRAGGTGAGQKPSYSKSAKAAGVRPSFRLSVNAPLPRKKKYAPVIIRSPACGG